MTDEFTLQSWAELGAGPNLDEAIEAMLLTEPLALWAWRIPDDAAAEEYQGIEE